MRSGLRRAAFLLVTTAWGCASGSDGGTGGIAVGSTGATTAAGETTGVHGSSSSAAAVDSTTGTTAAPIDAPGTCPFGALGCPCNGNDTCDTPLVCTEDVCGEPVVCDVDPNEPNDYRDEATDLGAISDDDGETLPFAGVLDDADDADWFSYQGSDIVGQTVDPAATLTPIGGALELCMFFQCDVGQGQIVCPPGTQPATKGDVPGCCGAGAFGFAADGVECVAGAFETSGTLWISVREASASCVAYSGVAHF